MWLHRPRKLVPVPARLAGRRGGMCVEEVSSSAALALIVNLPVDKLSPNVQLEWTSTGITS